MWILAFSAAAWAQQVPNGSFETGSLAPWTAQSGGWFDSVTVAQGLIGTVNAPEPYPDGDWVLTVNDGAGACSAPFVVTRGTLGMQAARAAFNFADVRLQAFPTVGVPVQVSGQPSFDAYSAFELDVDGLCGAVITACVGNDGGRHWFDAVALSGPGCGPYVDADGDGVCVQGLDLDGDGYCTEAGEFDAPAADCDDTDPDVAPGLPELPGNGVDEDCDGQDGPDPDADADADADTDADTDSDTDADTDTDSEVDAEPTPVPPLAEALTVGSACQHGTGWPGVWLALPALVLLRARRLRA